MFQSLINSIKFSTTLVVDSISGAILDITTKKLIDVIKWICWLYIFVAISASRIFKWS